MTDVGPDFSEETKLGGLVAGIDEAGRGPWAGPVVAAAAIVLPDKTPAGLNDSKKLTAKKREVLFAGLIAGPHLFGIGAASVQEIDRLNIRRATFLAMARAVRHLPVTPDHLLIDGRDAPDVASGIPVSCLIGGDGRSLSIAAASILAKVVRDRIMARLDRRYPDFGWARNAGYGVPQHKQALGVVGVTPHHRKSFAPVRESWTQKTLTTY